MYSGACTVVGVEAVALAEQRATGVTRCPVCTPAVAAASDQTRPTTLMGGVAFSAESQTLQVSSEKLGFEVYSLKTTLEVTCWRISPARRTNHLAGLLISWP